MQFNPEDQSTLLHLQCLPISNSFLCGLLPYQGTSERSQMVSTYHLIKTPALHHWTECNTVTLFCIFTVFPLNSTFLYTLIMPFSFCSVLNLLPDIQPDLNMYISHISMLSSHSQRQSHTAQGHI